MQTITVIAVGKLKEEAYRTMCREYETRLSAFGELRLCELEETKLPENPSHAQITSALAAEAERIRKAIPKGAYTVACCVEGKRMDSVTFSQTLEKAESSRLCFLIGGSHGLEEALKREASLRVSFSDMTFPHHLFRVMLLEQVYRAFMIRAGRPYHK